jgi:ADP-heptose:LPS heptosyltransferase
MEKFEDQLRVAGIADVPPTDLSWLDCDVGGFALPARFALFVPGGAPHRPDKRAPAALYAALGNRLAAEGVTPVLIGTGKDVDAIEAIAAACPGVIALCDRTDFGQLAALARRALFAVGNDTGPMHLCAAVGCPALVLFSHASNDVRVAPRGRLVRTLRRTRLEDLRLEELMSAVQSLRKEAGDGPAASPG